MLQLVYNNASSVDEETVQRILEVRRGLLRGVDWARVVVEGRKGGRNGRRLFLFP
jgi:hypothetical protein